MPQGSRYDENGKLIWKFDICTEFDCEPDFAKCDCKWDFTKKPCIFLGEHEELNINSRQDEME